VIQQTHHSLLTAHRLPLSALLNYRIAVIHCHWALAPPLPTSLKLRWSKKAPVHEDGPSFGCAVIGFASFIVKQLNDNRMTIE